VISLAVDNAWAPCRVEPTLWGLSVEELHDRLWASAGVRVVRRGCAEGAAPARGGRFLLVGRHDLVMLPKGATSERVGREGLLFLRLSGERKSLFVERVVTGPAGEFRRFERDYRGGRVRHGKCAVTTDAELARRWREAPAGAGAWRRLREEVCAAQCGVRSVAGRLFDSRSEEDVLEFARGAVVAWPQPGSAVPGLTRLGQGVWGMGDSEISSSAALLGGVWLGRKRTIGPEATVVGAGVFWDEAPEGATRWGDCLWSRGSGLPLGEDRRWDPREGSWPRVFGKRLFDIVFALCGLILTLPLYPVVMLAIWLEDGGPCFYGHRREGRGGREFLCWKFRSMRKDADRMKAQLREVNQADGPQFFIPNDPRLTKVGALLRRFDLDELPQFWNVLRGEMSVVGPRPSPHGENQFCPEWREARLSVRPGMTGLWQVKRTRQAGSDFQEWIQYDMEYVESAGWGLDLWVLGRTIYYLVSKKGALK
jgi:lipopolysaccharide/colanic/teichoic acid biosynthesis glycosyltransferase